MNVVRSDTSLGFSEPSEGVSRATVASLLLASYKVTDSFATMVRLGVVYNAPRGSPSGTGFLNPVLGAAYSLPLGEWVRMGLFFGVALPLGSGGGDTPDPAIAAADRAGIPTRSSMDNAMFAVNDLTAFPGVGVSFSRGGFTAQVEATVLQLFRVRGQAVQPDAFRTNFTSGIHLGYFILPQLSVGGELRYQRWLSTPASVVSDPPTRDTLSAAIGVRTHWSLGEGRWLRPGLSYMRGLDPPMASQNFSILQLDIAFIYM